MVVADLHVHTTNSDGTLTLETLPEAAQAASVDAVAVTDHDRLHPGLDGPVVERDGVTVVHGIELRVEPEEGERVDLLGYGVEPTDALAAEVERIQRDRVERGRAIVEGLEDHLGVSLDVAVEPGLGRPDVARAVADHPDTDYGYEETFDELIGDGDPFFVSRDVPSFERGVELLREACSLVGLAHPMRYDDPEAALELAADLDAVELHYPYGREVDATQVEQAIREYDLLPTGGTDAHEETLGVTGLDAAEYEQFRSALERTTD
ncbi:PHP domain-containing protein [Halobacteriales archaeon QS_1_68_20]|nr:MAG: PHP domain-containing protein [Halobacteriales archaeon QS_1_68_20]